MFHLCMFLFVWKLSVCCVRCMMVLIVLGKMKEILQVVHVTLSASQTGSSLLYCQLN